MKRLRLLLVLAFVLALAADALAVDGKVRCFSVGQTSTQILPVNLNRVSWSLITSSGAPAFWWNEGATAVAHGQSVPAPVGPTSYTNDVANPGRVYNGAVNAVSLSTSWICTLENF